MKIDSIWVQDLNLRPDTLNLMKYKVGNRNRLELTEQEKTF